MSDTPKSSGDPFSEIAQSEGMPIEIFSIFLGVASEKTSLCFHRPMYLTAVYPYSMLQRWKCFSAIPAFSSKVMFSILPHLH